MPRGYGSKVNKKKNTKVSLDMTKCMEYNTGSNTQRISYNGKYHHKPYGT